MFTKLANELGHHIVRILGKYILSGKFTCWPWKSSFLSGFTNLPTPKTAKVYVNLLEVNGQIVYGCMRNLRVTLSNSGKSTLDVRRLSKKYGKLSSVSAGLDLSSGYLRHLYSCTSLGIRYSQGQDSSQISPFSATSWGKSWTATVY